MAESSHIMLILLWNRDRIEKELQELMGFGRKLQQMGAGTMALWILGSPSDGFLKEVSQKTGLTVTVIEGEDLTPYQSDVFCRVIVEEIAATHPAFVCTPHTSQGWEWAPFAAARLHAGCICGVDGVFETHGQICFQKDVYGGKLKGLYAARVPLTVVTVQPGTFKSGTFKPDTPVTSGRPGGVVRKTVDCPSRRTRHLGRKRASADATSITAAPVIVAVGNGIGEKEQMALIYRLAERLPRAEIAGTRIVCDRGWLAYDRQVGVTGATVSPALYLACGISGAAQHVMGMRDSRFVVAINRDPCAPIFNEADIRVVEDLITFLPFLETALAKCAGENQRMSVDSTGDLGEENGFI